MDRYAPRKILQSSSDKPVLPQRCIALQLLLTGVDGDAGEVEAVVGVGRLDGETPPRVHASDIISHVTLIFESSRYVDCIRSASASLARNIPSFLPSVFFFANIPLPPLFLPPTIYGILRLRLLFRRPSLLQHQMFLLCRLGCYNWFIRSIILLDILIINK